MSWRQVIEGHELLDDPGVTGESVAAWLERNHVPGATVGRVDGPEGRTDFVRAVLPGARGHVSGGDAPTLGLIGQLGGIGARPEQIGFVSDGDGALTVLAAAACVGQARDRGDVLPGDVVVTTHICPDAPTRPHDPVPFMSAPVDIATMNAYDVDDAMDAVLAVDTTKGNRICNHQGFAVSPTVKEGWILRVADDLLDVMSRVTGRSPVVLPLSMQDITPYGNGVHHVNSILQPATATSAPVVGVALTTETAVPGSGTGATDLVSVEAAVRFCVEVAKGVGAGSCSLYDPAEFDQLLARYGSMRHLQALGDPS